MAGHSPRNGCWEVERLKECLTTSETALGAGDMEAADARAANAATCTELTGELNFFASFAKIASCLNFEPPCFSAIQG